MSGGVLPSRLAYAEKLIDRLFADCARKLSDKPYTNHLRGVRDIVAQFTDDEEVLIAVLLHDVLEDIDPEKYDAKQLEADFGSRVLKLVQTVSHDEKRYGKDEARRQYLRQLREGPKESSLMSAADMLHNGKDMIYWYTNDPKRAAETFGGEHGERAERRSWFWAERYAVIEEKLGAEHLLVQEVGIMWQQLSGLQSTILYNES